MGLDAETHIDQGEENMRFEKALSQHGASIVYLHLPGPKDHSRRGCWKCLRTRVLDEYHDTVFSRHSRRAVHVNSCDSKHKTCTSTSQTKSPHQGGGGHEEAPELRRYWQLMAAGRGSVSSFQECSQPCSSGRSNIQVCYESANWTWKILKKGRNLAVRKGGSGRSWGKGNCDQKALYEILKR